MSDGKRKLEEDDNQEVKKLKTLTKELMEAPVEVTPKPVRDHYRRKMTAPNYSTDDDRRDKIDLGENLHVTNEKNPAFKTLFGDDVPVETEEGDVSREKGEKGGGGFWSFLGIGGRKRRRRKKSRKKKKSKKRKSRRRRKRGGVGDKLPSAGWCEPNERLIDGKCVPMGPMEEPTCKEDEEVKYKKNTHEPYCEKIPTKGGRRRSRRRKKRRKSKKRKSRRRRSRRRRR